MLDNKYTIIALDSPADLLVRTPDGKAIGIDGGKRVSSLEDAIYTGPDTHPEVIFLPNPPSNDYTILVQGVGNGKYDFGINKNGEHIFTAEGIQIKEGEINYFSLGADGVYRLDCDFDGDDIIDDSHTINSKLMYGSKKPPYSNRTYDPPISPEPAKEDKSIFGIPTVAVVVIAVGNGLLAIEIGACLGLVKRRSRIRKSRKRKKAVIIQQKPQGAALVPYVQQQLVKYGLPAPMLYAPPALMQYMPHAPTQYLPQAQMPHYQTIKQPPLLTVYQAQMQPTNKDLEQIAAQAMEYFNSFNQ